jgi:nitrate reductase gamma subunit
MGIMYGRGNGVSGTVIWGVVVLVFMISAGADETSAGWRIDGRRLQQSVHAETTCLECHSDIDLDNHHPDPANVNKTMTSFFDRDKCLQCHDDVQGQIEDDGEHGGETVEDEQRFFNCIECHDPHYDGAPDTVADTDDASFSQEDQDCAACHLKIASDDTQRAAKNRSMCFTCHGAGQLMPRDVPCVDPNAYQMTVHADLDCMVCHPTADRYRHNQQVQGDCLQCHQRHEEHVAHEAHTDVTCGACHLGRAVPVRDARTHEVVWQSGALPGVTSKIHDMARPAGQGCVRCHFKGNTLGAVAMILPPKSVLCMPCHAATFSAGDTTTLISLAVFGVGMLGFVSLWFSGTLADTAGGNVLTNAPGALKRALATVFSKKSGVIVAALWYDVFLQRRLFRRSVPRWVIHALIFWPFVIRFVWGVVALTATNWFKHWPFVWALINKNHPVTALLFDATGLLLIVGIVLALVRGGQADKTRTPGLPGQDRLALGLLAGIVIVGFGLEGLRIAMTGAGGSAAFAFIGFGVSRLFFNMSDLTQVYGYVWYLHAILTGAFVAYIPFSRMMHLIMSPIVLAMNAVTQNEGH